MPRRNSNCDSGCVCQDCLDVSAFPDDDDRHYSLSSCPYCFRDQLCDFHIEQFPQDFDPNCPLCYAGTGPLCAKHNK
jgi:hypothetical protein